MATIAEYIQKTQKEMQGLIEKNNGYSSSELLLSYRGEPRDYGKTKLKPSLFREEEQIDKEMHLFELFCDYNIVPNTASNIEKAIEAQHYASISRMLDISFDVLVALYFASEQGKHKDEDGYVFVFAFPKHYSPHSKYIEQFYTDMLENKHTAYARNFKVFSHSYSNERIKAQKGGFVFFPGEEYYPISNCYYRVIKIKKEDKVKVREELNLLFQINEATVFPEKINIAQTVKEKFSRNEYFRGNVSVNNEIETYFERVSYEIDKQKKKKMSNKEILRIIRKEEKDFIDYFNEIQNKKKSVNEENEDQNCLKSNIEKKFHILKLDFMEG